MTAGRLSVILSNARVVREGKKEQSYRTSGMEKRLWLEESVAEPVTVIRTCGQGWWNAQIDDLFAFPLGQSLLHRPNGQYLSNGLGQRELR